MQAFESVGLVRTLAEPNLTAVSGESAHFLVGGEFPVPVGEDSTGRVTVDFKQYGVGLGFTPVVMSKGRISLKLSTEVSEITNTGAFTLSTSSTTGTSTSTSPSLVVPGLNVRRAETVVELPSGQSMMIAGLLQSVNKETLDSLPGLMQVPVLGALFRSRDYLQGETELVIIVTPYLVKPTAPGQLQTPADGLIMANDLETNLLGKLNKSTGSTPPKDKTYQGPIGYVVE
jgi:pilus assembly protein CpaC